MLRGHQINETVLTFKESSRATFMLDVFCCGGGFGRKKGVGMKETLLLGFKRFMDFFVHMYGMCVY